MSEADLAGGDAGEAAAHPQQQTFRGRSLAEVLPKIKEELGENAVAVSVRHGRTGGVGGFFAQKCVEVDAVPGVEAAAQALAPRDEADFEALLAAASSVSEGPVVEADVPGSWEQLIADARSAAGAQPDVGEVLGEPRARESASALAAMFTPDAATAPAPVAPAPVPPAEPTAPAVVHAAPAPSPVRTAPLVPALPAWPDTALAIHRSLTEKGMDPELVSEIVGEAVDHLLPFSSVGALRPLVAGQLARCLPPLPRRRPGRVVIGFVGAGGAGKTKCAARLALAYARRDDRPVACLTLRSKDRGAELMADVSEAGVAVHAADDAASARAFVDRMDERAIVVVDTPGVSPKAEAELRRLAAELRQLQLDECHLVLPATLSPWAAGELVRGTGSLGVGALALTHVDETDHLGAAIGAAIDAQLPVSYVGRGGSARGGLRPALVEALALELVG
jgi:flagellar biosynthesis GTPase FlhF